MQSSELKEEPCLHPQDGAVGGPTASVKESLSPSKESSLQIKDLGPESAHRLFRSCRYPEAPGLLRSVRKLKDLCRQWLRPDIHSTEEMLELLTVEQFLAMLPKAVRVWVHGHHPQNIRQAVFLVETLKRATSSSNNAVKTEMPSTDLSTLKDVDICFSDEEWQLLDPNQKTLYYDVMSDIFETVSSLSNPLKEEIS